RLGGAVGEGSRVEQVGRSIHQIAGGMYCGCGDLGAGEGVLGCLAAGGGRDVDGADRVLDRVLVGARAVVDVVAEQGTLGHGAGVLGIVGGQGEDHVAGTGQRSGGRSGGAAQPFPAAVLVLDSAAEPDQHQEVGLHRVPGGNLGDLAGVTGDA